MFTKSLRLLAFAALLSTAAWADQWSRTFTVSGTPELRIDGDDAAVNVRVWDRKEIEARVTTIGWTIGNGARGGEVRVIDHQAGDRVDLEILLPHHMNLFGTRSVTVDVRVPRELRSDIRTGDGNISVESLRGSTRLATGDGRIEADALEGALSASSGDGRINVRGRFDVLELRTGDGGVDAEVDNGSKMASDWRVRSGDGRVVLRLPADFAAEVHAQAEDGRIESEFPVMGQAGRHQHQLQGRLNGGGRVLNVRTADGSIRLERR